jgi:hypothetical protein
MEKILEMVSQGIVHTPTPLHLYPLSEVEKAFRFIQGGTNTGRIILTAQDEDRVPVSIVRIFRPKYVLTFVQKFLVEKATWRMDSNASYVVAGGLVA